MKTAERIAICAIAAALAAPVIATGDIVQQNHRSDVWAERYMERKECGMDRFQR